MINELLWFGLMIFCYLAILLIYRLFGRKGLFAWVAMSIILANVQVMKTIQLFGLVVAEGNIVYSSIFFVSDILNEIYGKKEAKKAVFVGFFILITMTVIMQVTLMFVPDPSDTMGPHLDAIFGFMPRIAFASLTAYICSQMYDVWMYALIKKYHGRKLLWFRSNTSVIFSQLIDNTMFTLLAFYGIFSWSIIFQIYVTSLILKIAVSFSDTPFLYWARSIKPKED
ncbi:MAG TPA: queuosine precursor transporter [Methanothrix sp.]|nr:queuosine precursor transporter [Methanothrix sp.]